jgi:hypothetical protein
LKKKILTFRVYIEGGTDTVVCTLKWIWITDLRCPLQTANAILVFLLAMVHFPEAQQKAQAEIDDIVGDSRLPEIEDMDRLPYTNCLIQEVLRWGPIVPIGDEHIITVS